MNNIGEEQLQSKLEDFKNHLEHADRMILSAKFGDGKSFFLQKVREDKELFNDYDFITIYPVNYTVAKNEDVFEYIKRDIILQLKNRGVLESIDLDALFDSIVEFEDLCSLVSFLLSFVPGGPFYNKIFDKFTKIKDKYDEKKHTADKYLSSFSQIKGCIYEKDAYTQLINTAIKWMSEDHSMNGPEWKAKKTVLIIEDLDRLDPAHLFRILNVISAHIDNNSKPDIIGNKFGFSNIIIVMDYDTTRYIFEHFYGKSASYEGYMSKFLSEEPFRYSLTEIALSKLKKKIIDEIGVKKELFDNFRIMNMKLSDLSMRDIIRLYDLNISTRIKKSEFSCLQNIILSLHLPIFKLFIYMTELGMSITDIDDELSLKANYDRIEYLRLVYPLYLIVFNKETPPDKIYDYGSNRFEVVLNKNDNVIYEIRVEICQRHIARKVPVPSIEQLNHHYAFYCQLLTDHIDLSGFNCSKSFSISGYMPQP